MKIDKRKAPVALMIGKKFGFLTVISYISGTSEYLCKCDCGKEVKSRSTQLKNGRHRSCGCGLVIRKIKQGHNPIKRAIYKGYIGAAKRRSYEFSLTREEFYKFIEMNCAYCGVPPATKSWIKRHEDFFYNGVDRVNNKIGYTIENCVPCCDICNNAKSTLTVQQWFDWIDRVGNYQQNSKWDQFKQEYKGWEMPPPL